MTDRIIQLENINHTYGQDDFHLKVDALSIHGGSILGVIGPNGSGKSTLLKIAAGILQPLEGRLLLNQKDMRALPRREIAKTLAYLPQSVNTTFDYNAEEIVAMGRFPHQSGPGFINQTDKEIVVQCMEMTETLHYRQRILSHLSGGEKQRVMLASVLAQQPKILMLDEPTTGLDLHHQIDFFNLLSTLSAGGMAITVITHDLNLAAMFCNKLILLNKGTIIRHGDVDSVIHSDILSEVYQHSIHIGNHPLTGKPFVFPVMRK